MNLNILRDEDIPGLEIDPYLLGCQVRIFPNKEVYCYYSKWFEKSLISLTYRIKSSSLRNWVNVIVCIEK